MLTSLCYAGALDIGGTKVSCGIVRTDGTILAESSFATEPEQGPERQMLRAAELLRAQQTRLGVDLAGIGVGCTGPVYPRTGAVGDVPFLPGWNGFGLVEFLWRQFSVPIFLENDADAALLGEVHFGTGRGCESFILITLGTGIGGGIWLGGLLRGAGGAHPEIGHMIIHEGGRACSCGGRGCWEATCGGAALMAWAQERFPQERVTAAGEIFAREVFRPLVTDWLADMGAGLANLITLYAPQRIALTGGLMKSAPLFWDDLLSEIRARCHLVPFATTELVRGGATELARRPKLSHFSAGLRTGRFRRIILTGMGSSFFAAIPLQYRLLCAGLDAHLLETSELVHCLQQLLDPANLLVVISQSGQSAEVIHLLEKLDPRVEVLAVTNEAESPLALAAESVLLIHAGKENAVSCKTYLNTLAALTALGDDLTESEALLPQLAWGPRAVDAYLQNWQAHVAFLAEQTQATEHLFLLGRGNSLATASTGALIIKEASRVPAQAMSAAAFRHGPIELIASNVLVLVFAGASPAARAMNQRLVQDIRHFGGIAHLVESLPVQECAFHLPPVPAAALPILEILLPQILSLALAERRGHEAGVFHFGTKITRVL